MLISIKNKKINIYVKLSTFKTQIERKKNLKLIKKVIIGRVKMFSQTQKNEKKPQKKGNVDNFLTNIPKPAAYLRVNCNINLIKNRVERK